MHTSKLEQDQFDLCHFNTLFEKMQNYIWSVCGVKVTPSHNSQVQKTTYVCPSERSTWPPLTFFSAWKMSSLLLNWQARPKSEILTLRRSPMLLTRTFRADRSRWIICSISKNIDTGKTKNWRVCLRINGPLKVVTCSYLKVTQMSQPSCNFSADVQ